LSKDPKDPPQGKQEAARDPNRLDMQMRYMLVQKADDKTLWAQFEMDCQECGTMLLMIPAHHLKSLHHAIGDLLLVCADRLKATNETILDVRSVGTGTVAPGSKKVN